MEAVLVALITGGMSLLGVLLSNAATLRKMENRLTTAQAVTDTKLTDLTREVRTHNNFAQRVPVLEERLQATNHRIAELENKTRQ